MAKQIDGGKSLWNQSQIVETHGFIVVIVVIIFLCGRNWNNTGFSFFFLTFNDVIHAPLSLE